MALKCSEYELNHAIDRYIAGESMEDVCEGVRGLGPVRLKRELVQRDAFRSVEERYAEAARKSSIHQRERNGHPDGEMVALYQSGVSEKAVAGQFGVSRSVVRTRLLTAGVTPRDRSGSMLLRMSQASAEERQRLTAAAHEAGRGRVVPIETKLMQAATKQERLTHTSHLEVSLAEVLEENGLHPVPQLAIGIYNVDLAVDPVAVEVWGGGWHFYGDHAARHLKRTGDLFDAGWNVFVVVVTRQRPIGGVVADEIRSFVERSRRDPSFRRQERMVWGNGEPVATRRGDLDKAA